jgi:hypothetical protein
MRGSFIQSASMGLYCLIVANGLIGCGESVANSSSAKNNGTWTEVQANGFLGRVTQGISSISIGHQFLTLDTIAIDEGKKTIDYVYIVDREAYVDHAYSVMHVNYHTHMLMYVDFELRKELCKDVHSTEMYKKGYKLLITRKMKDEDTRTIFTKKTCMLYL